MNFLSIFIILKFFFIENNKNCKEVNEKNLFVKKRIEMVGGDFFMFLLEFYYYVEFGLNR